MLFLVLSTTLHLLLPDECFLRKFEPWIDQKHHRDNEHKFMPFSLRKATNFRVSSNSSNAFRIECHYNDKHDYVVKYFWKAFGIRW